MESLWAAETAASGDGSGYWLLVLVLMGIGFLGVFARWRKHRRPVVPSAVELRERDSAPNRYRDAADAAIVELLETSRALNAQVDNKIRILNRLVKDAETHSARLEKLLAQAEGIERVEIPVRTRPTRAAEEETVICPPPTPGAFLSELHERVFMLRREGKNISEIAKATNLSTTEVRFALDSMGDANG